MKTFKVLFVLLLGLAAASCNPQENEPVSSITIPAQSQTAFSSGLSFEIGELAKTQTKTVTFTTSDKWTAKVSGITKADGWVKVQPESGNAGTVDMTVIVETNTEPEDRSATVTITCGSESKSFTVNQKGATSPVIPTEFAKNYLIFTSEGSTTLSLVHRGYEPVLYYSKDRRTWTRWDYSEISFTDSEPLYLCGDNPYGLVKDRKYCTFVSTGDKFGVTGSIMSLISKEQDLLTILVPSCFIFLFQNCTNLVKAPDLPAMTLTPYCYEGMFAGCTSLTEAPALPALDLASECYLWMFKDCTSLKSITIPSNITEIGSTAFENSGLTSFTFPSTLKNLQDCVFRGCKGLTSITIPSTLEYPGYSQTFRDCTGLISVNIQNDYISWREFSGCKNLKTVTIGSNVTSVPDDAFEGLRCFLG